MRKNKILEVDKGNLCSNEKVDLFIAFFGHAQYVEICVAEKYLWKDWLFQLEKGNLKKLSFLTEVFVLKHILFFSLRNQQENIFYFKTQKSIEIQPGACGVHGHVSKHDKAHPGEKYLNRMI